MVSCKRLNYGFNGYEVPPIPRAARSIRRRGPVRKNIEDNQMCAFDLLATVADKILLEGQSPATACSNEKCKKETILDAVREEQQDDHCKDLNVKPYGQGSFELDPVVEEHEPQVQNRPDKEIINPSCGSPSRPASEITASGWTDNIGLNGNKVKDDDNSESSSLLRKLEGNSSGDNNKICVPKLEDHGKVQIQSQLVNLSDGPFGIGPDTSSSEAPKLSNQKLPALDNSDTSIKEYLHGDCNQGGFPFLCRDNVKVVSRDDDENSSKCFKRSTAMKTSRSLARIGDRRIRKLLASRYWKAPSKVKDGDLSDTAGELHSVYQSRKIGFKRQRSRRIYPLKKRKLFYSSPSTSDVATGCEGIYMSSNMATDISASGFGALGHRGMGALSRAAGQSSSFQSRESHVKVRIKSFRVPELFVELPETATIGSLKRTVMEAITTLLGGGLHVGVVFQGRKIRDDSKTLAQSGVFLDKKDGLGFTLEPNHSQVYSSMGSEDMPCTEVHQPVARPAPATDVAHESVPHASADNPAMSLPNIKENNHDSAPSPAEIPTEEGTLDSKQLVTIPAKDAEALAVVPPLQRPKRCEMGQRRIRRPFSVAEVEALVQAVEKLGTGRWRDVKMQAFDNVKHRTYVDLKDKWKTLVHTATISPQQRRGEPVPQELLDRVLAAHAYWTQQQAKQHLKQDVEDSLLL